jgi:Ca2+-binding EF-hand superfamily protein
MNSTIARRQIDCPCCIKVGTLTFVVAATVATALAESPSAGDAALFERLDADRNGRISAGEISSDQVRLFTRLIRRADVNNDKALSRDEFLAALVPSRPEKPIEAKLPSTFPQAEAVRWLLLTLDTSGNSWIEAEEVPDDMRTVFEAMIERMDANQNGVLERSELSRGGPPLARIAGRYARQNGIDIERELKKLEKSLGPAVNRFELQRVPLENLGDPKQARELFVQLDGNGNGHIEAKEIPEPFQRPIQRMMRLADRDGDDRLSQREFLAAAKRLAQRQARQAAMEKTPAEAMAEKNAMPAPESPGEAMPAEEP